MSLILIFRLFSLLFSFFVQNGLLLSKVSEQRKSFLIFFCSGGSKAGVLSLTGGGRYKTFPWKGGCGCRGQGWQLIPPQHFHREKEAIDHRFGCSLNRTTYTRSIENGRWRGLHRRRTTRAAHLQSQSHRWRLHRMQYPDVCLTQICTVEVRSKALQDKDFQTMVQCM